MAKFKSGSIPSNKYAEKSLLTKLLIAINTDDGEEDYDTTWYPNGFGSNQITVGNDNTGSCDAGFRFVRPSIPNNAKITKAVLQVKAAVNSTKRPKYLIKGAKEVASNTFGAGARPSQRAKTTASVAWDIAENWVQDTWYETPDIKAVIQEILDQAEYTGKAIALVIEDNVSTANHYENIYDFNSGQANAARLVLTFGPNI